MTPSDEQRRAFESELKSREPHANLTKSETGYGTVFTEFDWQMWQAAWAASRTALQPDADLERFLTEATKRSNYPWSGGAEYNLQDWKNEGSLSLAKQALLILAARGK